jgi:hypothetical protein
MSDLLSATKFFFDRGVKEITLDVLQQSEDNFVDDSVSSAHSLNLFVRNKKLSHLIARSWLPGAEGEKIKATLLSGNQSEIQELMIQTGVVLKDEAKLCRFDVNSNPQPNQPPLGAFAGSTVEEANPNTPEILIFKIPYPQKIESDWGLTEEQLRSWLATSPESEPWEPFQFSRWIPYTC